MAKKHDINMIAQWAKEYGIRGYEHLDPKERQKHQYNTAKRMADKKARQKKYESN